MGKSKTKQAEKPTLTISTNSALIPAIVRNGYYGLVIAAESKAREISKDFAGWKDDATDKRNSSEVQKASKTRDEYRVTEYPDDVRARNTIKVCVLALKFACAKNGGVELFVGDTSPATFSITPACDFEATTRVIIKAVIKAGADKPKINRESVRATEKGAKDKIAKGAKRSASVIIGGGETSEVANPIKAPA